MKNVMQIVTGLLVGLLASSVFAAPKPWFDMVGKYSVTEKCEVDYETGFNRGRVQISKDGKELVLTVFKGSSTAEQFIPITSFQHPAESTDGDEFMSVKKTDATSFESVEHFVRKGSDTWPDLEIVKTFKLELNGDVLTYTYTHQDTYSKMKPKTKTCVLTSLADDQDELVTEELAKLTDKNLAKLLKAAQTADASGMDLDQGSMQIGKARISKSYLSQEEIEEVLATHVEIADVQVKVKSVTRATEEQTAVKALETAWGLADDKVDTAEYKTLRQLKATMIEVLKNKSANVKALIIEWNHSDADGEGLLLIDQENGEVLYVGSGYFS